MSGSPTREGEHKPPGGFAGNQKALLVVGVAVLAVLVVGATFGLGYIIGNQNSQIRSLTSTGPQGRMPAGNMQQGQPPGGPQQGQRPDSQGQQANPQSQQQGQQPAPQSK